jgi:predicted heme/steroid binding protein/uncharacterized membrane protein
MVMKEFTLEEVQKCNGRVGNPIYVVHKGRVIDVSKSMLWMGGLHMNRHHAGGDLSADIQAAPHAPDVLDRYPQVGVLKQQQSAERQMPKLLALLLKKYPFFKRHPHPMTVHFPIVFGFSVVAFNLLYLFTDIQSFEITALHCLAGGILFAPVAIVTGFFTWWLNYFAKPSRPVNIKICLGPLLWVISVIIFVWRIAVPDILHAQGPSRMLYLLLILSLVPIVSIIGWFGATMTFPLERE